MNTDLLLVEDSRGDVLMTREAFRHYLRKPVVFDAFESLVRGINRFWLTKSEAPQLA
jgi:hypothetical protein